MIVEDEMFVRRGIRSMMDWQSVGIDRVWEAANGLEALELYRREHPDIILTDLKMPVMDGMALIRAVRGQEGDARTRFVIMSCLDEFPLVQEALNLGVSHYFLKVTANPEDIHAVLGKIVRELDAAALRSAPQPASAQMEELLQNLSEGRPVSADAAARAFSALDMDPAAPYALLLIRFSPRSPGSAALPDAGIVCAALGEIISNPPPVLRLSAGHYALLLKETQAREIDAAPDNLSARLSGASFALRMGLSLTHTGAGRLTEAWSRAQHALGACFFSNSIYRRFESDEPFRLPGQISMRLLALPGAFAHLPGKFVDTYDAKMCQFTARSFESPDAFLHGLCAIVVWLASQTDCICDSIEDMIMACTRRISESAFLLDAVAAFEQFTSEMLSLSSFSQRMPASITAALLYIHSNLDHALTLNEIAAHTHLNPSYLSTLFHKVMRQSLISYVNSVRIDRARLLLKNTDLSISRIASGLGFSQDIYFYRLFKRIARETPSEYRARIRSGAPAPADDSTT